MKQSKLRYLLELLLILVVQSVLFDFATRIIDGQSVRQIEGIGEVGKLADLQFRNSLIYVCTFFFAIACSLVVLRFSRSAGMMALVSSAALYGSKLWVVIIFAGLSKFGSDWVWIDQNLNPKGPMMNWGGICFTTALLAGLIIAEIRFGPKSNKSGPE